MSLGERFDALQKRLRSIAVDAYNEADGDIESARLILRKKRLAYGFDIATAMLLFQLAMMLWKWAKDNGYLTEISVVEQEGEPKLSLPEGWHSDE